MIKFLIGFILGCYIGIAVMCLMFVAKDTEE